MTGKSTAKTSLPLPKRILFLAVFVFLNLIAAAVLVEIVLRLQLPAEDADLRWYRRLPETHYPINEFKNRDFSYVEGEHEGITRIVCVGDSFTYGEGVYFDDAYPKRLERKLNQVHSGREFEVLNYGKRGYNTDLEVGQVKSTLRFKPDVLILGFCLNDPESFPDQTTKQSMRDWLLIPESGLLSKRLSRISILYSKAEGLMRIRKSVQRNKAYINSIYKDAYPGWQSTRKGFSKINGMCRRNGIEPVMVIFPLFFGTSVDRSYPFADIHRKIAAAATDSGFHVLDLLPVFQGMRTIRLVVHPRLDLHPNETAHRMTADAIFERLVELEIAPSLTAPAPAPN